MVLEAHLLGYRISAVSKSFTRQMGRNEFLQMKETGQKTSTEITYQDTAYECLSFKDVDVSLSVRGRGWKSA